MLPVASRGLGCPIGIGLGCVAHCLALLIGAELVALSVSSAPGNTRARAKASAWSGWPGPHPARSRRRTNSEGWPSGLLTELTKGLLSVLSVVLVAPFPDLRRAR